MLFYLYLEQCGALLLRCLMCVLGSGESCLTWRSHVILTRIKACCTTGGVIMVHVFKLLLSELRLVLLHVLLPLSSEEHLECDQVRFMPRQKVG